MVFVSFFAGFQVDLRSQRSKEDPTLLDGPVEGWLAANEELRPQKAFDSHVPFMKGDQLVLSPDGKHLAVCYRQYARVRVWDMEAGHMKLECAPIKFTRPSLYSFLWTRDGRHICAWNSSQVFLLSAADGSLVAQSNPLRDIEGDSVWLNNMLACPGDPRRLLSWDASGLWKIELPDGGDAAPTKDNEAAAAASVPESPLPLLEDVRPRPSAAAAAAATSSSSTTSSVRAMRNSISHPNDASAAAASSSPSSAPRVDSSEGAPAASSASGSVALDAAAVAPAAASNRSRAATPASSKAASAAAAAASSSSSSSAVCPLADPLVKAEEVRLEERLKDKGVAKVAVARKRKAEEKAARLEVQKHAAEDEADHERQTRLVAEDRSKRVKLELTKKVWAAEDRMEDVGEEMQNVVQQRDELREERDHFAAEAAAAAASSSSPPSDDHAARLAAAQSENHRLLLELELRTHERDEARGRVAFLQKQLEIKEQILQQRPAGAAAASIAAASFPSTHVLVKREDLAGLEKSATRNRVDKRRALDDLENEQKKTTCSVCLVQPVEVLYEPCGHAAACAGCAGTWTGSCPICQRTITKKVQVESFRS
jgi:hypothetical protein